MPCSEIVLRSDPHVAFWADDVAATRRRLMAAGATSETDVQANAAGDELAMLRDPWGLGLQLVRRKDAMIPKGA